MADDGRSPARAKSARGAGTGSHAPLRVVPAPGQAGPYPPSLPPPPTELVGREAEVRRAAEAIAGAGHRLVTLIGTGGVGKSRLATEVATRLAPALGDGVVFVALSALGEPGHVLPAVAQAAGWTVPSERPAHDVLVEGFRDRPTLLVLDNVEHVIEVAPAIADLLDAAPELRVLATSRVALRIRGEHTISIDPLGVPDPSARSPRALSANASAALLVQTVRGFDPAFELTPDNAAAVAEICVRLEGLPLAIELAAARLRLLSPNELARLLAQRLEVLRGTTRRDAQPHHRTMRATIDWSYQLLPAEAQPHFLALGVFAGGFGVEAASAVAGVDVYALLDTLEQLVEHHLVCHVQSVSGDRRFDLLDTIREFAVAELGASGGEHSARDAHADWCLATIEELGPELVGSDPAPALARIDEEHDNVRAAFAWLTEQAPSDDDRALRLATVLWRYWWIRGHATEGRDRLARALDRYTGDPSAIVGKAHHAAGELAEAQGDLGAAAECLERARRAFSALGDEIAVAECWNSLGMVARARGDLDDADALHHRALAVLRERGDRRAVAVTLNSLAGVAYYRGRLHEAEQLWDETVSIVREIGDVRSLGLTLGNLGSVRLARGDLKGAKQAHEEGLSIGRQIGDRTTVAHALCNLGEVYIETGDFDVAEEMLTEALAMLRELGERYPEGVVRHNFGRLMARQGEVAAAAAHQAAAVGVFAELGMLGGMAGCQEHLGMLAAEHGRSEAAIAHLAAAATTRQRQGSSPLGPDAEAIPRWRAVAAAALDPERVAAAERAGASWTPDESVVAARAVAADLRPPAAVPGDGQRGARGVAGLTPREVDVARLLIERRTDQEIADALFISLRTVTTHVSSVLRKLAVPSRRDVGPALTDLGIDLDATTSDTTTSDTETSDTRRDT